MPEAAIQVLDAVKKFGGRTVLDQIRLDVFKGETLVIGTRGGVRDVQRNTVGFQADMGRWSLDGGEPLVRAKKA